MFSLKITLVMAIRECTLRLTEATPSGICPVRDPDHRKELDRLTDQEGCWRKYQRWLIGRHKPDTTNLSSILRFQLETPSGRLLNDSLQIH